MLRGSSRLAVRLNIRDLLSRGTPPEVAARAALRMARQSVPYMGLAAVGPTSGFLPGAKKKANYANFDEGKVKRNKGRFAKSAGAKGPATKPGNQQPPTKPPPPASPGGSPPATPPPARPGMSTGKKVTIGVGVAGTAVAAALAAGAVGATVLAGRVANILAQKGIQREKDSVAAKSATPPAPPKPTLGDKVRGAMGKMPDLDGWSWTGPDGSLLPRRLDGESYQNGAAPATYAGQFDESKHARDHGRFSSKPGAKGEAEQSHLAHPAFAKLHEISQRTGRPVHQDKVGFDPTGHELGSGDTDDDADYLSALEEGHAAAQAPARPSWARRHRGKLIVGGTALATAGIAAALMAHPKGRAIAKELFAKLRNRGPAGPDEPPASGETARHPVGDRFDRVADAHRGQGESREVGTRRFLDALVNRYVQRHGASVTRKQLGRRGTGKAQGETEGRHFEDLKNDILRRLADPADRHAQDFLSEQAAEATGERGARDALGADEIANLASAHLDAYTPGSRHAPLGLQAATAPVVYFAADGAMHVYAAQFDEDKHPRGQPGNAGQFGAGGGKAAKPPAEKPKTDKPQAAKSGAATGGKGDDDLHGKVMASLGVGQTQLLGGLDMRKKGDRKKFLAVAPKVGASVATKMASEAQKAVIRQGTEQFGKQFAGHMKKHTDPLTGHFAQTFAGFGGKVVDSVTEMVTGKGRDGKPKFKMTKDSFNVVQDATDAAKSLAAPAAGVGFKVAHTALIGGGTGVAEVAATSTAASTALAAPAVAAEIGAVTATASAAAATEAGAAAATAAAGVGGLSLAAIAIPIACIAAGGYSAYRAAKSVAHAVVEAGDKHDHKEAIRKAHARDGKAIHREAVDHGKAVAMILAGGKKASVEYLKRITGPGAIGSILGLWQEDAAAVPYER